MRKIKKIAVYFCFLGVLSLVAVCFAGTAHIDINTTTGDITLDPEGSGVVKVDNLALGTNTLSSTDANGNILLTPNGTGKVGIVATSPDKELEVEGDILVDNDRWKYYSVPGAVGFYDSNWSFGTTYYTLDSDTQDSLAFFPIHFMPGTEITAVKIKWVVDTDDSEIELDIIKREEATDDEPPAASFTSEGGGPQAYSGKASGMLKLDTWDCTDFTISENYSYTLKVKYKTRYGSHTLSIFAIGFQTSERVY